MICDTAILLDSFCLCYALPVGGTDYKRQQYDLLRVAKKVHNTEITEAGGGENRCNLQWHRLANP